MNFFMDINLVRNIHKKPKRAPPVIEDQDFPVLQRQSIPKRLGLEDLEDEAQDGQSESPEKSVLGDENKEEEKSEIDVSSAQLEDEKEAQDAPKESEPKYWQKRAKMRSNVYEKQYALSPVKKEAPPLYPVVDDFGRRQEQHYGRQEQKFRAKFTPQNAGLEVDSFLSLPKLAINELIQKIQFRERLIFFEVDPPVRHVKDIYLNYVGNSMKLLTKRPKVFMASMPSQDIRCDFHLALKNGDTIKPYQNGVIAHQDRFFLYKLVRTHGQGYYQIIDVYPEEKVFATVLNAPSMSDPLLVNSLMAFFLQEPATHVISANVEDRTFFKLIFEGIPQKSKSKRTPYSALIAQAKVVMLIGAVSRDPKIYFSRSEMAKLKKYLIYPLCTKENVETIRDERLLLKEELLLFKDGAHFLSYMLRFDVDVLRLIELTRLLRLDELRLSDLPNKKETIDRLRAIDFMTMPDYSRDNLFMQLYQVESFRQQHFETLISLIKPTKESLTQLSEEDCNLILAIKESYQHIAATSMEKQPSSKSVGYYIPRLDRNRDPTVRQFQVYVYCSEFQNSDVLELALQDFKIKFKAIPNSKVFYQVMEFSRNIDSLLYRLTLTRSKVRRQSKMRKLADMQHTSIYFICEKKFYASDYRSLESYEHYPHDNFFRFYLQFAEILPTEFIRELLHFYEVNRLPLPQIRDFQYFTNREKNSVKIFCFAATFLRVFDQVLFRGEWLERLLANDKKKLSSLNQDEKEQLTQYFNHICPTLTFDLRIKLHKIKSYLPHVQINWRGLKLTDASSLQRALGDFKTSDFSQDERNNIFIMIFTNCESFEVMAYLLDMLRPEEDLELRCLARFIHTYFPNIEDNDGERGFAKMDLKRLARCFQFKEFRAYFRYTASKAVLLAFPQIVLKTPDEVLCYSNILVSAVYRWVENIFSVLDKPSMMEVAPSMFQFFKALLNKFRSTQLEKVLRFMIESFVTTNGLLFLELIAQKKIEIKYCATAIEDSLDYNFRIFYENANVAGQFLEALGSVMKRINVTHTVRRFFKELYEHYRQRGLHPFEISGKELMVQVIGLMKQLGQISLAQELIDSGNGILRSIARLEITGGEFSDVIKRFEGAILQFIDINRKSELQKKDYLMHKGLFLKLYEQITMILYYFSEMNYKIEGVVQNDEFRRLHQLQRKMDELPLDKIFSNSNWLKEFDYLKCQHFVHEFKHNELVRNMLEAALEPQLFTSFKDLDAFIYTEFINKTLAELNSKLTMYCEGTGGKLLTISDASRLNKIASREHFEKEIKQIMTFFTQDRPTSSKHVSTLVQHLGRFFDILPQLNDIKNFLEAGQVLGIKVEEDAELSRMSEAVTKIYEFTQSDGELSEVSKHTPLVESFFKKLFSNLEEGSIERFKEFSVAISRAGELVAFLREYEDFNFQDLIDVIDDTAFEADAFLRDVILVKEVFTEIWEAMGLRRQESGLAQMKAAFAIWRQNPRQDLGKIVEDCCSNVRQIETKIEEQLDRSGQTQELLKMLYERSEICFMTEQGKVRVRLHTQALKQAEENVEDEKVQRSLEFEEYSQIIARCNMYNVQQSREEEEGPKNEQQKKRVHMGKVLFLNYNIGLKIKNHLRALIEYGYLFLAPRYAFQGRAQDLQEQLQKFEGEIKQTLEFWNEDYFEARRQYKSLYFLSPGLLKEVYEIFHEKFFERDAKTERVLKAVSFVDEKTDPNVTRAVLREMRQTAPPPHEKNQRKVLKHLGDTCQRLMRPPPLRKMEIDGANETVCSGKKFALRRIKQEKEIWAEMLYIFACHKQFPQATQVLFCSTDSEFQVLEQFVLRARDVQSCYQEQPLYLLVNFQKLPLLMQIRLMDCVQRLYDSLADDEVLNLCILYTAEFDHNAHVLEELKVAKLSERPLGSIIATALKRSVGIKIVRSEQAGLGKSDYVVAKAEKKKIPLVRCPCYGEMKKSEIIDLLNQRMQKDKMCVVHLDVYNMNEESIHSLLFELLVFRKLHWRYEKFCVISEVNNIYVEVANTFANRLWNSLDYLRHFTQHECDKVCKRDLRTPTDPEGLLNYACNYLQAKVDNVLHEKDPVCGGILLPAAKAKDILNKEFIKEVAEPNYYQLQAFIAFLGRQVHLLEESAFMGLQIMKWQELNPNNRTVIVQNLVRLARNFASQVHRNQANHSQAEEVLVQEMARNVGLWENYDGFLLAFNADGSSIRPFYKKVETVPQSLRNFLSEIGKIVKQELQGMVDFDQYSEEQLLDIMMNLCVKEEQNKEVVRARIREHFPHIVLTKDNVIKMTIIFLRVMARIPVIIMGETGVGKTILIQYLSQLIEGQIETLNVHAGLSQQHIRDWVINTLLCHGYDMEEVMYDEKVKWEEWESAHKLILFFDEINTNPNVGGILKEILVDRKMLGRPLPSHVVPIGAANPYKLRKNKNDHFTQGLKIEGLKSSKLVYLVHPLPESMLTFVWDFGVLKKDDELRYIHKIVQHTTQEMAMLRDYVPQMADCLQVCQKYARDNQALWAVSLRDLRRWSQVLRFFVRENFGELKSFSLSLFYCYFCRFDRYEVRHQFEELVSGMFPLLRSFRDDKKAALNDFADTFEEEPGIAMNLPLKENTFLITVSILNNIPIILTGPPGSSKTLSTNLVYKNMKGPESRHKFWRTKPKLIYKSYQCSELSTSLGIQRCFELAKKVNLQYKDRNRITVILLDEIGLAEKSPSNPLKVLHSLLETANIPVIGLSNWQLDAAKMNRFVHASRPSLHLHDLKDTVRALKKAINRRTDLILLDRLAQDFDEYTYAHSQQDSAFFHGTRDFYQLVSFICRHYDSLESEPAQLLMEGIQRNFGGKQRKKAVFEIFHRSLKEVQIDDYLIPQSALIQHNLLDEMSRHLMVITQNAENAISCLEGIAHQAKAPLKVFLGSDFKDDTTEKSAYDVINQIVLCMEQGAILVMLNLDFLYQSFYDLLNQNYTTIRGKRFCRIAIGSDSYRYEVHPKFKAVVIAAQADVFQHKKYDPAFLNRFEKQLFNFADLFTQEERKLAQELTDWLAGLAERRDFTIQDLIPVYTTDLLESLVFKHHSQTDPLTLCQNDLTELMAVSGIVRARDPDLSDLYWNTQQHSCLIDLLENAREAVQAVRKQREEEQKEESTESRAAWADPFGFRIILYTTGLINFDTDLSRNGESHFSFMKIEVTALDSQNLLTQMLTEYFEREDTDLLIIVTNVLYDVRQRILLVKNKLSELRQKYEHKFLREGGMPKNVLFVIRTVNKSWPGLSLERSWRHTLLENIAQGDPETTPLECLDLMMKRLDDILDNELVFNTVFNLALPKAVSMLEFEGEQASKEMLARFDTYRSLFFGNETENKELLRKKMVRILEPMRKAWYEEIAFNRFYVTMNNTFLKVLQHTLVEKVAKELATLFHSAERGGLIGSSIDSFDPALRPIFLNLWHKDYEQSQVQHFKLDRARRVALPFANIVAQRFMELKQIYIEQFRKNDLSEDALSAFQQLSKQSIEKPVGGLLHTDPLKYLSSLTLHDSYSWLEQPFALDVLTQVVVYFQHRSLSAINMLAWAFQDFLKDLGPSLKELDGAGVSRIYFKRPLKQCEPQDALTNVAKIRSALVNNILDLSLECFLYDVGDGQRFVIDKVLTTIFHEVSDLLRKYHELVPNPDSLGKLRFYCKLSKLLGQGAQCQQFFANLRDTPLDQIFYNTARFTQTLDQLCALCPKERHPSIRLQLFKIALSKKQNELILKEAALFVHNTAGDAVDPQQYVLCKQLLETMLGRLHFAPSWEQPQSSEQVQYLQKVLSELPMTSSLFVMLTDVVEARYFEPEEDPLSAKLVPRFKLALSQALNEQRAPLYRCFDLAMVRSSLKKIAHFFTQRDVAREDGEAHFLKQMIETLNKQNPKEMTPFAAYLGKLIKQEEKFTRSLESLKKELKLFGEPSLFKKEKHNEEALPWEGEELYQQFKEALSRYMASRSTEQFHNIKQREKVPLLIVGMLASELVRGRLQLSPQEVRTVLSSAGLEPTPAAEITPLLVGMPKGLEKLAKEQPLLVMGIVVGMASALLENKRSFVYQLVGDREKVGETFLPFLVDSDFNKLVDAAFLKEKQLTRYLCEQCQKYYLFIGECGNINHGNFQAKCPLCGNRIGAQGYGKPIGLKRCDPNPVQSANRNQLYVVLPGFQESRPADNEQVRGVGGLALREGRFYTFTALLLLQTHYGHKIQENEEKHLNKHFLEVELEHEWATIKSVLGRKTDMDALTVVYAFCSKLVYTSRVDHGFNRDSLTATSIADRDYRKKKRDAFEEAMLKKALIPQAEARAVLHSFASRKQLSKMDLLLMEGTEAEGLLGEVSRFVRLQTPIEMRVFRQALGNAGQTAESSFWNMLIRQEKEFNKAARLRALQPWFKLVRAKLNENVRAQEALEMTARDFIEQHGCEVEFAKMAQVWNECAAQKLNLGIDCEEIFLGEIDDSVRMIRFCLSSEETSLGYVAWLFLRNVIGLHNLLFGALKDGRDRRLASLLSEKATRLFKMDGSNFFGFLDFEANSTSETYFQLEALVARFSATRIESGRGGEVVVDFEGMTQEYVDKQLANVLLIEPSSLEQLRFKGEFGYENKILDVCDRVAQEKLTTEAVRQLERKLASVELRFELIEKLDVAMSFVQKVGAHKEQALLKFLDMFQIRLSCAEELKDARLQVKHIVAMYELIEMQLSAKLLLELNPRFRSELEAPQSAEVRRFFTEHRAMAETLVSVLKRFCIRRFRGNPRINVDESLGTLLFAEYMGSEEFWGVGNEAHFEVFVQMDLPQHWDIFRAKAQGIHRFEHEAREKKIITLRQTWALLKKLEQLLSEEQLAEEGEAAVRDSDMNLARKEHQRLKEELEGEVGLNVMG